MAEPEENDDALTETTSQKRLLPVRRIFMLSSLLFYVGYSYSINEGFGIPLLLEAGLSELYAPIVFGVSSILSVFVAEYLGSASDRCTSLLGRRRPYIIGLSVIVLAAAIVYPYGVTLSSMLKLKGNSKAAYVITHTAVCVIVFDVFLDMTNAIDRSYLIDSMTTQQSNTGNSIFSALTNAGACVGGLTASLDWERILGLSTGGQTKVVFVTIILVLFVCVILTLNSVKEPHIGKDGEIRCSNNSRRSRCYICCNYFSFDVYKKSVKTIEYELQPIEPSSSDEHTIGNVAGMAEDSLNSVTEHGNKREGPTIIEQSFNYEDTSGSVSVQESVLTTVDFSSKTELQNIEKSCNEQCSDDLTVVSEISQKPVVTLEMSTKNKMNCVFKLPRLLYIQILSAVNFIRSLSVATIWLWITHFLEWIAVLSLNFFLTIYVASVVYNGSADADPSSESFRNYNKGIRMGFACQSIEFGSSFIFSLLFKRIISVIRLRELVIGIHILTFISSGLLIIFSNIYLVASLCIIIGWFYALVEIIPFTIIQQYKVCICVYY